MRTCMQDRKRNIYRHHMSVMPAQFNVRVGAADNA